MKLRAFILSLMVVSLGHVSPAAYAGRVPVPAIPLLEDKPALTIAEYEAFAAMAKYAADEVAIPRLSITGKITTPRVGSTTSYGVTVTADLAAAFDAHMRGDGPAALAALDAAEAAAGDNARSLFEISMLRAQIHIMTGRSDAAVAETARAETYEIQTFKTNVNSRALRGEARLWAGDFEFAINDLAQVAVATREWRLPTSYNSQPTNMGEMFNMTTVQLRAYGALAATYVLLEDFAAAPALGVAGRGRRRCLYRCNPSHVWEFCAVPCRQLLRPGAQSRRAGRGAADRQRRSQCRRDGGRLGP